MERKRRCFAYAESDEKACGYDGPCGAYATMPFRRDCPFVMRPVFGRDGLVPSVITKVLQLPLGNKRKI